MVKKKVGIYSVDMEQKLGEGSSACVFRGKNLQTNQDVAVKVISKSEIKQSSYIRNAIQQQIKIMMKLKSTNIIGFLHVHQTPGNIYIIMQIADEGNLRNLILKNKETKQFFTEEQTIKYLFQLLNGFSEMVKFGVIHRDIKPQNIFIKNGKLKIGDFGFAKNNFKSNSIMSTQVGSPAYMAPQILNQQSYSYKCDIWSLGIMAYEMITGAFPFGLKIKDLKKIYEIIKNDQIVYPSTMSKNMTNFIKGCLQFYEKDRFDWEKVFLHPLFEGVFLNKFNRMKKGQITLAYTMSTLRVIISEYNINIISEMQKMDIKIFKIDEFKNFLEYLNCDISKKQTEQLCDLLQRNGSIQARDFLQFLQKYECNSVNHGIQSNQQQLQKFLLIRNLLKKINSQQPIDFAKIISQKLNGKQTISVEDFKIMIKQIAPQIPEYIIPEFFIYKFDIHIKQEVSQSKFITLMKQICQAQIDQ